MFDTGRYKNCDTLIYMTNGLGRDSERLVKQAILDVNGKVLGFEDIYYQLGEDQHATQYPAVNSSITTNSAQDDNQPAASTSVSERLRTVKNLMDAGLISEEEAASKRAEILATY